MNALAIQTALAAIRREKDPSLKSQELASLCAALFRKQGVELVVVGGSAIEFSCGEELREETAGGGGGGQAGNGLARSGAPCAFAGIPYPSRMPGLGPRGCP